MSRQDMAALIAVAKGEQAADLVLTSARIVNTFTGAIEEGNVAIGSGTIAGIGDYHLAAEIIDLQGKYLAPGLIDGHTHLESSLLSVNQYARAVVPRGTSAIVTDLHEITNVCGLNGAKSMLESAGPLPIDLYFMVPSCVPATHLETSGARVTASEILSALDWKETLGLGEVMNFSGVLNSDADLLSKLAVSQGKVIDGHAPGLSAKNLNAYVSAGIASDHECVSREEAEEKLRRGMWVMIREGSSEKNLESLLPLVTDKTYQRCLFVVDDRSCLDLLQDGDIDAVVRKAIRLGLDPVRAIQMATINPAQYFGLRYSGAIAPGYAANMIVLRDLHQLDIDAVFHSGLMVAHDGQALFSADAALDGGLRNTVHIGSFGVDALGVSADRKDEPVIQVVPGQLVTRRIQIPAKIRDGLAMPDPENDVLKAVVVERHRASGNIGKAFVKGFGLKRGALASSVAHDSHNIVAVGASDADILLAIQEIARLQGGLVIAADGNVLDSLPLPIAGILTDAPVVQVAAKLASLQEIAADLGCTLDAAFAVLSFLALPVIPELRLTDLGLVDVQSFNLIG